jgi:hypothetical protein
MIEIAFTNLNMAFIETTFPKGTFVVAEVRPYPVKWLFIDPFANSAMANNLPTVVIRFQRSR